LLAEFSMHAPLQCLLAGALGAFAAINVSSNIRRMGPAFIWKLKANGLIDWAKLELSDCWVGSLPAEL